MKLRVRAALVIGLAMALASVLFVRGVVLILKDYSRPDVPKGENTVGLVIVALLGAAAVFEAYRFLTYFFREHRASRHRG
ncbi:MAG TPA: hypothetical protein VMU05_14525 [Dongiaceae bacterium]|nr:hypothetical protein [Dongiaceae bacterium]